MKNSKLHAFRHKVIVGPKDFTPPKGMKVLGVCNSGVTTIMENGLEKTLLMPRITRVPEGRFENAIGLPYYTNLSPDNHHPEIRMDILMRNANIVRETEKDVKFKAKDEKGEEYECMRLKHVSESRTITLDEIGKVTHRPDLNLFPAYEPDEFGIEDVRITRVQDPDIVSELGGKYILTYVVPHRRHGVGTIISITNDFKEFERLPFGNTPRVIPGKDIIVFPEKCLSVHKPLRRPREEQYVGFRRPSEHDGIKTPGMVVDYSPDLVSWGPSHEITWEITKGKTTGIGTPPINLDDSWFSAFHEAVQYSNRQEAEKQGHTHFYHTKFMTLDLKEPWKTKRISGVILKRADLEGILPDSGYVPNVVYTTGLTNIDGIMTIYSGVDDAWVVASSFYTEDVKKSMR